MAYRAPSDNYNFQAVAGVNLDGVPLRSVMSAEECVRIGLEDFEKGKRVSVTGFQNKLLIFGSWVAPRNLVLKAGAKLMKNQF